jgi:hypothetical protein
MVHHRTCEASYTPIYHAMTNGPRTLVSGQLVFLLCDLFSSASIEQQQTSTPAAENVEDTTPMGVKRASYLTVVSHSRPRVTAPVHLSLLAIAIAQLRLPVVTAIAHSTLLLPTTSKSTSTHRNSTLTEHSAPTAGTP